MKAPLAAVLSALALMLTGCPNNNAKPNAEKNEVSHDRSTERMPVRGGSGGDVDTSRDPALDSSLMSGSDTRTTYGSGNGATYVPPGGSTGNNQNYTPPADTTPKTSTAKRNDYNSDETLAPSHTKSGTHRNTGGGGRTYTVKKGDTLSGISQKFYGTTTKWKQIQNANKAKVPNEKALKPGTVLVIP